MVCQAVKELREDWFNEGLEEGMEKGLEKGVNIGEAKLLRLMNIIPQDSADFNKALKGSKSERKQLYKKYNIE